MAAPTLSVVHETYETIEKANPGFPTGLFMLIQYVAVGQYVLMSTGYILYLVTKNAQWLVRVVILGYFVLLPIMTVINFAANSKAAQAFPQWPVNTLTLCFMLPIQLYLAAYYIGVYSRFAKRDNQGAVGQTLI